MPRLSNILNHLTDGKCAVVRSKPDDAIWADPVKMQTALDTLVEWLPGATPPTAQQAIDGAAVYLTWRTAEDARTDLKAKLAAHDAAGLPRPSEDLWVLMVNKLLIQKLDIPRPVLDRINAKRVLRGEPPL